MNEGAARSTLSDWPVAGCPLSVVGKEGRRWHRDGADNRTRDAHTTDGHTSCVGDELYDGGSRLGVVLGGELESPLKTTLTEPSPESRR